MRAGRRNIQRFPGDFMFELDEKEFSNLRSQFGTSSWGGVRNAPMACTEQGVAMLSSVLNSDRAISVNIQMLRLFTKLLELLSAQKDQLLRQSMGVEYHNSLIMLSIDALEKHHYKAMLEGLV